ncbi:MAG: lysozyme [Patescibacteria group bacterium]|nr:lysozyme [Patescibacteria group bacterium]
MLETLEQMIERHEGYRVTPYVDSRGIETIGIGHNLNKPLRRTAVLQILNDDIADATNDCLHAFPWFVELTKPRQWAMIDLCFNLGLAKLQTFVKFIAAMNLGDYETAANELMDSLWFKQVGTRGPEIVEMIRGSTEA